MRIQKYTQREKYKHNLDASSEGASWVDQNFTMYICLRFLTLIFRMILLLMLSILTIFLYHNSLSSDCAIVFLIEDRISKCLSLNFVDLKLKVLKYDFILESNSSGIIPCYFEVILWQSFNKSTYRIHMRLCYLFFTYQYCNIISNIHVSPLA